MKKGLFAEIKEQLQALLSQAQENQTCVELLGEVDAIAAAATRTLRRGKNFHEAYRAGLVNGNNIRPLVESIASVAFEAKHSGKSAPSAVGIFLSRELVNGKHASLDERFERQGFNPPTNRKTEEASVLADFFHAEFDRFAERIKSTKARSAFHRWGHELFSSETKPNISAIARDAGVPRTTFQDQVSSFLSTLAEKL